MFRTSLYFLFVALVCLGLADIEVTTLDPWEEPPPHRRRFSDTGCSGRLHLPRCPAQYGYVCILRHQSRRAVRFRPRLLLPLRPRPPAVRFSPIHPRDFLGFYFFTHRRAQSDVWCSRNRHSVRGRIRQGVRGDHAGGGSNASERAAAGDGWNQQVLLRHPARHLQRSQELHVLPIRVRPALERHSRLHRSADARFSPGNCVPGGTLLRGARRCYTPSTC